ncbi:hypothetical protein D3H65_02460 [Paraflavitalea soli]|uniref:Uncharacterized protein n=1 Tax=Paraflavitalea soli TaxID=2315862 RepID=A0A3B7MEX8_9BACT|nr:hypothetical protein [Paraflavitalea soli]AXY72898.1 hypothetical protein D3H65_02460 [Paraflavitalea soli]
MFSFFKRKRPIYPVPEWASFFKQDEYNTFISHIETYFRKKKAEFAYNEGVVIVENEEQEKTNHGLVNIAQQCNQSPIKEWKELITRHFDSFGHIDRFNQDFNSQAHDYEYVKSHLGVRLYAQDYLSHISDDIIITRRITEDIIAMLVFDFPHSVSNVKPEQSILWKKSEDELFGIGIINVKSNYQFDISRERLGDFDIWFVTGEHFFTPNIVFDLPHDSRLVGTYGSLVGIPHRHAVLIYPIESSEAVRVITGLIPVINGMHQEGPGSISDKLYWYYDNAFYPLPYTLDEKTIQFFPPEKFLDMMNELQ